MDNIVKILSIDNITHNVNSYKVEKPEGYNFTPGQATDLSINKPGWENNKHPFTFTSLSSDPFLEFTIKSYFDHDGVTNKLSTLNEGDELIIRDVWGAIEYKGAGYFIAGGAGVTPFIAILRELKKENTLADNKLFFSNKTSEDIILREEFTEMLGGNFINTLTRSKEHGYHNGQIDEDFLKRNVNDFSKHFYLCGPPPMVEALQVILKKSGASPESVVFEK
jgi:ferredoxin-NADP reductase